MQCQSDGEETGTPFVCYRIAGKFGYMCKGLYQWNVTASGAKYNPSDAVGTKQGCQL